MLSKTKKLTSINKRHTGSNNKDFNLRHDWNSLLNDKNLTFNKFSNEYYPSKEHMVEYLNSYYENNNLKIYNKILLPTHMEWWGSSSNSKLHYLYKKNIDLKLNE
jgi:hypothetical protein